jgi:hypothetical protein
MSGRRRWQRRVLPRFTGRPRRGGEPWRRFEVEQARTMAAAGSTAAEIGLRLGRSAEAVRAKLAVVRER